MAKNSDELLSCFVELSSNKERSTLEQSVVKTLCQILKCEVQLVCLYDARGDFAPEIRLQGNSDACVSLGDKAWHTGEADFLSLLDEYLNQLAQSDAKDICQQQGQVFWPLYFADNCVDVLVVTMSEANNDVTNLLAAIGCIFANFMTLLDAGERDALTGLFNRRIFDTRLSQLVRDNAKAHRENPERRLQHKNNTFYLGIIDIDFFKRVNDNYGHLFGDEVLLWLAHHMRHCFRNEDVLFRYGGEEFAVLLSGLNEHQAQQTFERFRRTIADTPFPQIGQITVSVGYCFIDPQANPTVIFGHADKALYYAKEHGRDRVECYQKLLAEKRIEPQSPRNDSIELF